MNESDEEDPKSTSRSNQHTKTRQLRPARKSLTRSGDVGTPYKKSRPARSKSLTAKEILEGHKHTIDDESSTPLWYCDPLKEGPDEMNQVKVFGNKIRSLATLGDEELILWTYRTDEDSHVAERSICKADAHWSFKTFILEVSSQSVHDIPHRRGFKCS